jgi:predicted hotdog family 3-hydroxylacyl-ACP dehydratase
LQPITDIRNLIPQKAPFIMVDTLRSHSKSKAISSLTIQKVNLFIENNTFLEAGLIENMAQTVALHTGYEYFLKGVDPPTGYIGAIKNIEILKLPLLKDTISTEVRIIQEFNGVTLVEIKVVNEQNEKIASCQMKTVISN